MRKFAAAAAALAVLAPPARAFFVRPYVRQTLGSQNYAGTAASVDLGEELHFKPAFNSYHSNTSSGTYKTYSLDAVYDLESYSLRLIGGVTPTVNNYNDRFVGGKVSEHFPLSAKTDDGALFRKVTLTEGVVQTVHTQQVFTPATKVGSFFIPGTTTSVHIQQVDAEGVLNIEMRDWAASLDLTKSVYDRDIARLATRSAPATHLAGLYQTIQGFPDVNATLKIECDRWDAVSPYASYTYTSFKAQPIAATYTLGAYVTIKSFELEASYQRYAQRGSADVNYYSFGASARFE